MQASNSDYVEVVFSGQQTYIQYVPGVSAINTENENLLDYLQAKVSSGQEQLTQIRQ